MDDYQPDRNLAKAKTIPRSWYVDPAFLEKERDKVFSRSWQAAGTADLVKRPGDFFATDLLGEPVVIVRGNDGVIRAFSNVCRHRAAPVASGKGNRKSLQCSYHGWTYSLEGRLLAQPEFDGVEDWNKSEICLPKIKVDTWGPYVFVNFDPSSPSLVEVLAEIPKEVEQNGFPVHQMRFIERRDYEVKCNWKVYIDNYLEGYHIPIAHPGLFREIDYAQYRVDTFRYHSSAYAPIRPVKENEIGRDRRYVRNEAESKALYYWIFPNFMINIYPDNLQANIVIPVGHDRTLTIFEWFFVEPGSGQGWESLQQSISFSDQIQKEDIELCEVVQRGLQSRTYQQGRYSVKRENGVHHFHLLLTEFLSR